jgi:Arc/MetJ family transcription regulator
MRTNIEIHDQLMLEAMRSGLARTKRATVEAGLGLSFRFEGKRQSDVYLAR